MSTGIHFLGGWAMLLYSQCFPRSSFFRVDMCRIRKWYTFPSNHRHPISWNHKLPRLQKRVTVLMKGYKKILKNRNNCAWAFILNDPVLLDRNTRSANSRAHDACSAATSVRAITRAMDHVRLAKWNARIGVFTVNAKRFARSHACRARRWVSRCLRSTSVVFPRDIFPFLPYTCFLHFEIMCFLCRFFQRPNCTSHSRAYFFFGIHVILVLGSPGFWLVRAKLMSNRCFNFQNFYGRANILLCSVGVPVALSPSQMHKEMLRAVRSPRVQRTMSKASEMRPSMYRCLWRAVCANMQDLSPKWACLVRCFFLACFACPIYLWVNIFVSEREILILNHEDKRACSVLCKKSYLVSLLL